MGLKITVYRNEHEGRDGKWYSYATPASSKNESGGRDSEWLDVVFVKGAKGTVLENKTRIDCTDCFLVREKAREEGLAEAGAIDIEELTKDEFDELAQGGAI